MTLLWQNDRSTWIVQTHEVPADIDGFLNGATKVSFLCFKTYFGRFNLVCWKVESLLRQLPLQSDHSRRTGMKSVVSIWIWFLCVTMVKGLAWRSVTTPAGYHTKQLQLNHLFQVQRVASREFMPKCNTFGEKLKTKWDIFYFFFCKLALWQFGHTLFGVFDTKSKTLVGFVDYSLQSNSGHHSETLKLTLYSTRRRIYRDTMEPYLCNLLVNDQHRRKGLASVLVAHCEERAKDDGYGVLNLHVDDRSLPALALYISNGFRVVKKDPQSTILYLSKPIPITS